MKWWKQLFKKKSKPAQEATIIEAESVKELDGSLAIEDLGNKSLGLEFHDLGMGCVFITRYRSKACWFYNKQTLMIMPLVDHYGNVLFVTESDIEPEAIKEIDENCPGYKLRAHFRFWIYKFENGKASIEWTVRPDGRYWADEDDYGMTDDERISLSGQINTEGKVVSLFKVNN